MRIFPRKFCSFSRQDNFTSGLLASVSTLSVVVALLATTVLCSHPSARPAKAVSFPALLPAPSPTSLSTRVLFPSTTPKPKFARERPVGFQVGIYVLEMVAYIGAAVVFAFIEPKKTPEVRPSIHGSGSTEGDDWFLDEDEDDDEDDEDEDEDEFPMDMRVAYLIALIALKEIADNNRRRALKNATQRFVLPPATQLSVTVPAVIESVEMEVEENVEVVEVIEEVEIVGEVNVVEEEEVESVQVEEVVEEKEEKVVEVKETEVMKEEGEEITELVEVVKVVVENAVESKVEVEEKSGREWQVVGRRGRMLKPTPILTSTPTPSTVPDQTAPTKVMEADIEEHVESIERGNKVQEVVPIDTTVTTTRDAPAIECDVIEPHGIVAALSDAFTVAEDVLEDIVEPVAGSQSLADGEGSVDAEEDEIVVDVEMIKEGGVCAMVMVTSPKRAASLDWANLDDELLDNDCDLWASIPSTVSSSVIEIAATSASNEPVQGSIPSPPVAYKSGATLPTDASPPEEKDGEGWETVSRRGKKTRAVPAVAPVPIATPSTTPDYSAMRRAKEERDRVNREVWQARQDEKAGAERAEAVERARKEEEERRVKEEITRRAEEKKRQLMETSARIKRALEATRVEIQLAAVKKAASTLASSQKDARPNWAAEVAKDQAKLDSESGPCSSESSSSYPPVDRVEPTAKVEVEKEVEVEQDEESVPEARSDLVEKNEQVGITRDAESCPQVHEIPPVSTLEEIWAGTEDILHGDDNEIEPSSPAESECDDHLFEPNLKPLRLITSSSFELDCDASVGDGVELEERTGGDVAPLELSAIEIRVEEVGGGEMGVPLETEALVEAVVGVNEAEDSEITCSPKFTWAVGLDDASEISLLDIIEACVAGDEKNDQLPSPEPTRASELDNASETPSNDTMEPCVVEDEKNDQPPSPELTKADELENMSTTSSSNTVEPYVVEVEKNGEPSSPEPSSSNECEDYMSKTLSLDIIEGCVDEDGEDEDIVKEDKEKAKEIPSPESLPVPSHQRKPTPNWADEVAKDRAEENEMSLLESLSSPRTLSAAPNWAAIVRGHAENDAVVVSSVSCFASAGLISA
ncbi:hypothetical protein DXG01_015039 [Tephrocybe rancida]|nr:hypothetical protein DXG01_015039 [Tephrocybe rancida]